MCMERVGWGWYRRPFLTKYLHYLEKEIQREKVLGQEYGLVPSVREEGWCGGKVGG